MAHPKAQHTVPRMLAQRFADRDGKLYFSRKNSSRGEVHSSNAKKLFRDKYIYTSVNRDGDRDMSLESYYDKLETAMSPILDVVLDRIRNGVLPVFTAKQRGVFDTFLYHQWKRVPDFHTSFIPSPSPEVIARHYVPLLGNGLTELPQTEVFNLFEKNTINRVIQQAKVKALANNSPVVLKELGSMNIGALHITKPNKAFIIGSQPVIKLTPDEDSSLRHSKVEIWLPISSDVAICLGRHPHEQIMKNPDDLVVRKINLTILKQSSMIAGCSSYLIDSLMHPR